MYKSILLSCLLIMSSLIYAQVAKDQNISLHVEAQSDGFVLTWPENTQRTGTYSFSYRDLNTNGSMFQFNGNTIKGPANSFYFKTNLSHVEFLVQYTNAQNQIESLGYIAAGNSHKASFFKGRTILLIDSLISEEAKTQITTLKSDLLASGWFYDEVIAQRTDKPEFIKAKIEALIKDRKFKTNTLYIIGHVPVPYSGYFSSTGTRPPPDGHVEGSGNHTGAWPADVYYGDFEGIWEDMLVLCTTGSQTRHHNKGGDGKFDPSEIPGVVTLDIGRVDFFDMPAFNESEIELTKAYLDRVHQWKMGQIPYVKRALIDNNFGSLNLASTGYHNFSCFLPQDSIFDNRDYFIAQNEGNYLWSYGCGAGSYTSCNGIGNTNNFASYKGKFDNIFTILAGSYFGDWDSKNNLLRAALASGSLATFWGGIPKWYIHHMGLGKHIGHGARITQNNSTEYFNGNFNASYKGVHIALLGDPTLEMLPVKPVKNLTAVSNSGEVTLTWNASADATEYEVYRIDLVNHTYIPVSSEGDCAVKLTDTFFTDACNWSTGTYTYGVLAANSTTTASGTYFNRSLLTTTDVSHTNSNTNLEVGNFEFFPNPASGVLYLRNAPKINGTWVIRDLSGREISRIKTQDLSQGINIQTLTDGLYIIEVFTKDLSAQSKIYVSK